jgi:hypothetical protein
MEINSRKPILVTGCHRSGTTWVGRMLSVSPAIAYIHEPFNPLHRRMSPGVCKARIKYQYTYVTEENEAEFCDDIAATIQFRYNLLLQLREIVKNRQGLQRGFRTLAREAIDFFLNRHIRHPRPLFKDPMALLSTEWLANRFNMDVVILIRHPAAIVSSIKRMNWPPHDFSQFLKQPLLMRDYLYPFEKEVKEMTECEHDVIDEGILLWRIFYYVVGEYRENHDAYIFLRHEDLSLRPVEEFKNLFDQLKVEFTESTERTIKEYSSPSNPSEAPAGVLHQLKRNSVANIKNWKVRLSESEIERIRQGVQDISSLFYGDEDWE